MQKSIFESIIDKYYLNSLVENVKWEIKDAKMNISFIPTEVTSLVGIVTYPAFNLENSTLGIYNTSSLLKLIKILEKEISIQIYKERNVSLKLLLSDTNYDLEFYLANEKLISPIPKINEPNYEITFDITKDFIKKFTSCKKALGDIKQFTLEANQLGENKLQVILGEGASFSNKAKFDVFINSTFGISSIPFQANLFNEVLLANENSDIGKLYLSKEGLLKVYFKEGDIESTYYLIRLEN